MFLVADSGSTKTHWEFIQNGNSYTVYTSGINPFYKNTEQIIGELRKELLPQITAKPVKIFFYGAGISQPDKVDTVKKALEMLFPASETQVEHDLLAAARATCGDSPGIACILGTGSNSCLYDGKQVTDNIPSLGFMLGDEGSGGFLGRKLLQAYYYRELPDDLKKQLETKHDMRRSHVLNTVHNAPMPNQVVASFAEFLIQNDKHSYIIKILEDSFDEFLIRHTCKYKGHENLPIHFIGSIAFLNREILNNVMRKNGLTCGEVLKSPMEGLVRYHSKKTS